MICSEPLVLAAVAETPVEIWGGIAWMGERSTFSGSAEELANCLVEFASSATLCDYGDESAKVSDVTLIRGREGGVESSHKLLGALRDLQSNLSFSKQVMKTALLMVHAKTQAKELREESFGWAVRMAKPEIKDWSETVQRRIRNCCRMVAQGCLKTPTAQWVLALPWEAGSGAGDGQGSGGRRTDKDKSKQQGFIFKFIVELIQSASMRTGWRRWDCPSN